MDKIHFANMAFYGYHGALAEESELGQKFFVDLSLGLDLRASGQSDDLADTVDYGRVFETVRAVIETERYHLLEALAERLAGKLFADFPAIQSVRILLKKPEAPIRGIFDHVAIEIERER
ncbi:MAG: dihydroneopterin aldolase [Puniceicoccales bacterium]